MGLCQVGDLLYAASAGLAGTIDRIDIATGNRTIASGDGVGSGTRIKGADGLAWDAARQRLLVTDRSTLFAVDPQTGDRTIVSNEDVGRGPRLQDGRNLVIPPDNPNVAYVLLGVGIDLVLGVDLVTGDRFLVSK
ncbi:MAG: hypothetical protein ACYTEG_13705 [Planctomycetota bacterium]|jgi:hypothetical protein